jgi:hypothetical protein
MRDKSAESDILCVNVGSGSDGTVAYTLLNPLLKNLGRTRWNDAQNRGKGDTKNAEDNATSPWDARHLGSVNEQ